MRNQCAFCARISSSSIAHSSSPPPLSLSASGALLSQKHDVNKLCAQMSLTEIFTSSFDQLDEMIVANLKVGRPLLFVPCFVVGRLVTSDVCCLLVPGLVNGIMFSGRFELVPYRWGRKAHPSLSRQSHCREVNTCSYEVSRSVNLLRLVQKWV